MPKKGPKAPIIDEETVWWFAGTMKFNPDSMMHKICQSHEVMREEASELRLIIREMRNFLALDLTEQSDTERQYLLDRTKHFMPVVLPQRKKTPEY